MSISRVALCVLCLFFVPPLCSLSAEQCPIKSSKTRPIYGSSYFNLEMFFVLRLRGRNRPCTTRSPCSGTFCRARSPLTTRERARATVTSTTRPACRPTWPSPRSTACSSPGSRLVPTSFCVRVYVVLRLLPILVSKCAYRGMFVWLYVEHDRFALKQMNFILRPEADRETRVAFVCSADA